MSINIDLDECCYKCDNSNLDMKESILYRFNNDEEYKEVLIKCLNRKVCKYIEADGNA